MDLKLIGSASVQVSLSRRNLLTLLAKLDADRHNAALVRGTDDGMLYVIAQEDDDHYAGRTPGYPHPDNYRKPVGQYPPEAVNGAYLNG